LFTVEHEDNSVPEYVKLWVAVIRRAAIDYALYKNDTSKKVGAAAEAWIFDENRPNDIGSFESSCEYIGLDVSLVREKISSLSEEKARRLRGMEFGDD
jgi:hypothetical protein